MAFASQDTRPGRWLRWLHRIGYVATALLAAELLAIAFFATRGWLENRQMRAARIEETRTHEGPLLPADNGVVRDSAVYLFGRLPQLSALRGDGLRFVAMPSFNQAHFAVAVWLPKSDATEAQGVLERFDQHNRYAPLGQREFHIPASAYRSLVSKLEKLADGWPGEASWCLDGTPTAFERVRARRVTSGLGGCGEHYDAVGRLVWNYLSKFAPGADLPKRADWEPSDR